MLNKILCIIMLGSIVGLASVNAQTPAAPAKVRGRIIAARITGHVTAISKVDGTSRVLKDQDQIQDQMTVVTSPGAEAILVFSNGATVNIAGDSKLDIDEFMQDPFASDQKLSDMTNEPGTSITKLDLTKGELVGKVVHLNVDKGSEFTVQTPVGAAGIRGTTFRIVFRPDPNNPGKAFFSVVTSEGQVVLRGVTSTPVNIPAGKQVVVAEFSFTPPSSTGGSGTGGTGGGTGGGGSTTPVTIVTTDITAANAALIQTAAQSIVTTVQNIVIANTNSGGGGGSGGNGGTGGTSGPNGNGGTGGTNDQGTTDTSTSGPALPATQTTGGAGS
jgi:FecR protein